MKRLRCLIAVLGALFLCSNSYAQITEDWVRISRAGHNLLEYEVHFLAGVNGLSADALAAQLAANPEIEAVKLTPEANTIILHVQSGQVPSTVKKLLADAGLEIDQTYFLNRHAAEPAQLDKVFPLLVSSSNNIDTYVVDYPVSLSNDQRITARKALLSKEGVIEIAYPLENRFEFQVKDFFTPEMVVELVAAVTPAP